jgi:hypothetical protein
MPAMTQPRGTCFVISAIGDPGSAQRQHANDVLRVIQSAVQPHSMDVLRSDLIPAPGNILRQVIDNVLNADLVIADLTDADPNVCYELAIRHATGKRCVQIIKKGGCVPEDLQGLRTVEFDLSQQLDAVKSIASCIDPTSTPDSPIKDALLPSLYDKLFKEMADNRQSAIKDFFDAARSELTQSLADLRQLTRGIEDATRKPVHGIEQVLVEAYDLLVNKAKVGGQVWFVGMTLGFGAPHVHRRVRRLHDKHTSASALTDTAVLESPDFSIDEVFSNRWSHRPELRIEALVKTVHERLKLLLTHAPRATVVCLPHDLNTLKVRFLNKLAQRQNYRSLRDNDALIQVVAEKVQTLHEEVARCVKSGVGYLESIPMQLLIVEQKEEFGHDRKACLVFHVGTDNIATRQQENGETGVYSEVDNIVEVFQTMAESLRDAAQTRQDAIVGH